MKNKMNANIITKKLLLKKLSANSYKLTANNGFTLIEMLVSIAVFMVVMTVASGSLASIIEGNGKAQSLKSAINNLNFSLESMAKNIRVGTDYSGGASCSQQDACIGFTSYKDSDGDSNKDYVVYRFNNNQSIERCVNLSGSTNCSNFTRLTAPEVHIEYANFYINTPTLPAKPRVLIVVGGYAGTKERIKTKFNLQTTVSQRQF